MLAAALGSAKLLRSSISSHISVINNLLHLTEAHLANYHNKLQFLPIFPHQHQSLLRKFYSSPHCTKYIRMMKTLKTLRTNSWS